MAISPQSFRRSIPLWLSRFGAAKGVESYFIADNPKGIRSGRKSLLSHKGKTVLGNIDMSGIITVIILFGVNYQKLLTVLAFLGVAFSYG